MDDGGIRDRLYLWSLRRRKYEIVFRNVNKYLFIISFVLNVTLYYIFCYILKFLNIIIYIDNTIHIVYAALIVISSIFIVSSVYIQLINHNLNKYNYYIIKYVIIVWYLTITPLYICIYNYSVYKLLPPFSTDVIPLILLIVLFIYIIQFYIACYLINYICVVIPLDFINISNKIENIDKIHKTLMFISIYYYAFIYSLISNILENGILKLHL